MDGITDYEANDVPYKSQKPRVMHAVSMMPHYRVILGRARF